MHEPIPPAATQSQSTRTSEMTTIGADTQIKGEMFFEHGARILGRFEGRITARGEVQIAQGAICNATIEAQRVVIDGVSVGSIIARDRLVLTTNARLEGDVQAGSLVIAEGAEFIGNCSIGERNSQEARRPANAGMLHEAKPAPVNSGTAQPSPIHPRHIEAAQAGLAILETRDANVPGATEAGEVTPSDLAMISGGSTRSGGQGVLRLDDEPQFRPPWAERDDTSAA